MNRRVNFILVAAASAALVACAGGPKKSSQSSSAPVAKEEVKFMPPMVPAQIVDPSDRLEYIMEHYWDSYNFADTALLNNREVTGSAFGAYAELLFNSSPEAATSSITALMERSFTVDSTAFAKFTELFESYFYDANSPYLNEEFYIPALQYIVDNDSIDAIYKIRPKAQLEMALKNRVGLKATNFDYTLKSGETRSMQSIKADFTLLYFNNPDCHDCARVTDYISSSQVINRLYEAGKIKILSVYPDTTLDLWRAKEYPPIMINSYDASQALNDKQLYDLKAIPTLYLLDEDKIVLLKDAPVEVIEGYLSQIG